MIYTIKRNGVTFFTHEIRGVHTQTAPAVDFIDIEFDYKEAVMFKKNDTIEFKGQTYYCDRQYNNENKQSSKLYRQRARFVSENYRATEIAVLDPQGKSTFDIEANLLTLLTLAVTNLNRLSNGWSYNPTVPNTVTKTFEMSGENVMSFLVRMSGEFQIPFDIKDKVISFREPQHIEEGLFKYGKGNGFLDLTKTYRSGERVPNLIYATGFEGLTPDINPIPYQPDIDENGVIEGFYTNENIKPTTRTQMVGSVTANNVVVTDLINYDLNTYKIAGQTPLINFETGALGGSSFYITNSTYDPATEVTVLYLKRRTIDGVLLPSNTVRPLNGDYFNITNIRQPQEVIDEAKTKLAEYAYYYLDTTINRNLIIQASLDPLFPEDLNLNDKIHIVDADLNIDGKFIINEIKESLQDLSKKDIALDFLGFSLYSQTFKLKNDNIIELGIDTNRDDIVQANTEIVSITGDIGVINNELASAKSTITEIQEVELPKKEDTSNKVNILEVESPTIEMYSSAVSVITALGQKQNKLVQGNNININQTTNTISVPNATSSQSGAVQVFSNTVQNVGANAVTNVANRTYGVQKNASDQLVVNVPFVDLGLGTSNGLQLSNNILSLSLSSSSTNGALSASDWANFNNKIDANDLDGFVYDATYNTTTHVLTLFRQNYPNVVIDFPTEDLIANIDVVGNDLVITFQDGTTKSIPLNTLLVGVVKSVNGLIPNSQGEIILQLTDIPNLSSELGNKLDIRMTGLVNNLTQPEKDVILGKLGVVSNVTQLLSLNSNTISLSGGGGSVSLGIVNIGGLQNALDGKANTTGNYPSLNAGLWSGQRFNDNSNIITPFYFMMRDANSYDWYRLNISDTQNVLGINTSWNLQQVTNNGNYTPHQIIIQNTGYDDYTIIANQNFRFLTSSGNANNILTGGLLASDFYGDVSLIPVNGIYSKGTITTASHGTSADWNAKVSQSQLAGFVPYTGATQSLLMNNWSIADVANIYTSGGYGSADLWYQGYLNSLAVTNKVDKAGDTMTGDLFGSNARIGFVSNTAGVAHFLYNTNPAGYGLGIRGGDASQGTYALDVGNYDGSLNLFRVTPSYSQFYNELYILNATQPNHAVAFGQLANYALTNGSNTIGGTWDISEIQSSLLNSQIGNGQIFTQNGSQVYWGNPSLSLHTFEAVNANALRVYASNGGGYGIIWNSLNFNPANYALLSQVYTQSQALALFVGLNGVQTIADTKTFTSSPVVPNGTLNGHAVNKSQLDAVSASIPNPSNNGLLTISTSADLTGGGTFSADQATASNVDIGLSSSTLSNIQLGVTANSWGNHVGLYPLLSGSYANPTWITSLDWSKITNAPTIPTVGNGQLSFTAPTGLVITGSFSANQSNNTTIPIDYASGYQGFTTTESNKLAGIQAGAEVNIQSDWSQSNNTADDFIKNKPTIPNAANNGILTYSVSSDFGSGGFSFSADQNSNISPNLTLSTTIKNNIDAGVDARNIVETLMEGVGFNQIPIDGNYIIPIIKKKTIVNISAGVLNTNISIDDAPYDGYELAINGCGEWSVNTLGKIMNKCGDLNNFVITSESCLFWWSVEMDRWLPAI